MTTATLKGSTVVIHNGQVLTTPEEWAAALDAATAEIAQLKQRLADCDRVISGHEDSNNRRVAIEQLLLDAAVGKIPQLSPQDCRVLSLRLGTPKEYWSDDVKNHKFPKAVTKAKLMQ